MKKIKTKQILDAYKVTYVFSLLFCLTILTFYYSGIYGQNIIANMFNILDLDLLDNIRGGNATDPDGFAFLKLLYYV